MSIATYKRLAEEQVAGWRIEIEAVEGSGRSLIHTVNSPGRTYPSNPPTGWQRWQPHVIKLVIPINTATLDFATLSGGMRVLLLVVSTGIRFWVASDIIRETGDVILEVSLPEDSIGETLIILPSFRSAGNNGRCSALDLWAPGKMVVDFVGQQSWFPVESRQFTRKGQFINVEFPDASECSLDDEESPLLRALNESVRIQIDMESEEWRRLEKNLHEAPASDASHHALTRILGFVVAALRSWEADLDKTVLDNVVGNEPLLIGGKPALGLDSVGWFVRSLHHRLDPGGLYKEEDTVFWLQLVSGLIAPTKMEGNNR